MRYHKGLRIYIERNNTMKLKHILLGLMMLLIPYNIIAQLDTSSIYDLKIKSNKVQVYEKRDGGIEVGKNLRLPETYFFFTRNGIYGADIYGILKYEFRSPVTFTEEYQFNRFTIRGFDLDFKNECTIMIFDYYVKNKIKIFFMYEKRQYVFDCVLVN